VDLKTKRFLWGVGLVWAPWIPTLIGIGHALRAILGQKATGIGAVAGGVTELFITWGIGAILIGQVAAIVLLFRGFSPAHWVRGVFSVLSIALSALTLLLVLLFLWSLWFRIPHAP
jgi:hypothetical protein